MSYDLSHIIFIFVVAYAVTHFCILATMNILERGYIWYHEYKNRNRK